MKLLDRCNNVSFMAHGFSPSKLGEVYRRDQKVYFTVTYRNKKAVSGVLRCLFSIKVSDLLCHKFS